MTDVAVPGTVYLVGAGPGDPDLVTRRASQLVAAADVVLADRLVPPDLLAQVRSDARMVDVGKAAGDHALPQGEINELMVEEARAGNVVVRLKGGDPYLFGRGGEEAVHCRAAGVPFEVVPAVTSAFAACADAGIPVTYRDIARHVTVVTASAGADGSQDPDYTWLGRSDGTIVLLMGLRRIEHVAAQLMAAGMDPHRPAAVIARGTTAHQQTVVASLSTLARVVQQAKVVGPAIIVVGHVVEMREHLDWFERRPLFGVRVGVTRASAQASGLAARLARLGAIVVEAPTVRIERRDPGELDALIRHIDDVGTIVFTSRNGVDALFDRLAAAGLDSRALAPTRIAVVGLGTADALRRRGIEPDVIPPEGSRTSMGLLDALAEHPLYGTRCAVVRAEQGDDRFLDGLQRIGARVLLTRAYRTVAEEPSQELVEELLACDVLTFTSESTVRNLAACLPNGAVPPPAVTIGPTTTSAALWCGLRVLEEAADTTLECLVDAVVSRAAENRGLEPWRVAAPGAPEPPGDLRGIGAS